MQACLREKAPTPVTRLVRSRPIQIVVTPGSGSGRAMGTALALHDALRARRFHSNLAVFPTLDRLRRWASADGEAFSAVVCVGGDATQSTTALAALRRSVPFLPISSGFGNLFAQAFDHPDSVEAALDLLAHGQVIQADVGTRNGEVFLCEQSYGLIADVQEAVEAVARPRARWRRWLAYYRAALGRIRETRPPRLRVVVDDQVVATDAAFVAVANVRTYGRWLPLLPDASPIDGLLDVFVMRARTQGQVCRKLLRRHLRVPGQLAGTQICRGIRVSVSGPPEIHDELEVQPCRLPVVVSQTTLAALERASVGRDADRLAAAVAA